MSTDQRAQTRAVALVARLGVDAALIEAEQRANTAFLEDAPGEILHWQNVAEAIREKNRQMS
jgi:hypothetical protein